ncbi:AAA family ATPase [Microvirga makkahensis]|uniref:AAA family ATPase n=1 Tax=Microvirga makkahensis TaxID=1128670 RepID=A0A7X3MPL7_9HYPH|nr:AAA family ATPase [Microvirga makkahensis]MXQ10690.1 AAA family ATPase [Microvirga makkahensis]
MKSSIHNLVAEASLDQRREIAAVPRVVIQAFCDSPDAMEAIELAAQDRLMARARVTVHSGGAASAVQALQSEPTPSLIVVESRDPAEVLLSQLDRLAEICDAGTKVLVIGHTNDVAIYRELVRRGVSDYIIAPVDPVTVIAAISGIYSDETSDKLGQVYAFTGAKGGVGSSTIAHNVGWMIGHRFGQDVILADMDLPFGTGSLDLNLDPAQGINEAIQDVNRLDSVLLDRLLTKYDHHLSLLAAPVSLERTYELSGDAFDPLLDIAQASAPFTVLDIPHLWTSWAKNVLTLADQVVITAEPDLANLRNAKNMVGFLKQVRPNDPPPKIILNRVGMPKRPEIKPRDFADAIGIEPIACVPFEAHLFGTASNNGQMIPQVSAKSGVSDILARATQVITGRKDTKRQKGVRGLSQLVGKFTSKVKNQ